MLSLTSSVRSGTRNLNFTAEITFLRSIPLNWMWKTVSEYADDITILVSHRAEFQIIYFMLKEYEAMAGAKIHPDT